jgi:murein DD-endopeptidase MepM/ murein hydrolase activator NlpD
MSKRKNSPPLHSSLQGRILLRLSRLSLGKIFCGKSKSQRASRAHEQTSVRGRQRNPIKNATPQQRVRIVQFSTWGSDYRQIDLSARTFWGIIFCIVVTLGALTVLTTLEVGRLLQNYRISVLDENQQTLRNRMSQTEARVDNLSRRANNLDGETSFGLTNNREQSELPGFRNPTSRRDKQNDDFANAGRTSRESSNKRGPLGLEWNNESMGQDAETPAAGNHEVISHALADSDEEPASKDARESLLFFGQGGGAYVDEEDNIYPTLLEKERAHPITPATKDGQPYNASAGAMAGGDLITELEKHVSHTQELQKTILEKFEIRRKQLEHIPSIKPLLSGRITDLFGKRTDPFVARTRHHQGIDIGAPRGTEVFAPANGVVEFVKMSYRLNRGYGRAVVINHGYGIKTLYGHLSKIKVKAGQRIERWDVIGLVGETGRATGPHLHYEVWVDGETQDPLRFILNN